ncbi:ribonuclease HI [Sodalis-like secondary symbiont of Drepanosiphum platanoidis]|uniref:ribonuclease HI n=1 Tax=Sodalis-like secondary symbiont of Drepanosiphum platanoidis TaxID=2994493 RepID=UPI003464E17E
MYKKIDIFTDGSCLGNPGPGGCGSILRYKKHEKILSSGYYKSTNNRMELLSVIISLETLKCSCDILIRTDSQYVKNGITKWIYLWKKNSWMNKKKIKIKNFDLWKRLDIAIKPHNLNWIWIKGHSGNIENDRCDKIARFAALNPFLEDTGYLFKSYFK